MSVPFERRRRQQFILEAYADAHAKWLTESIALWKKELPQGDTLQEQRALAASLVAGDSYELFSLRYSAGSNCDDLRNELANVVVALENYQQALEAHEQIPHVSPLGLDRLVDYERAMQILGLCILLHRPDLLRRVAALTDPGYKGEDTLYEALLAFHEEGRVDLDEWYHDVPYTTLVHAMYEADPAKASRNLNACCEQWYASFKYAPWHDGHLRINGTDGDYFGYWAFEAGAVALLCDIDDGAISHMVYPKELVAWSRAYAASHPEDDVLSRQRVSVPGGRSCPRVGWWFTPAKVGSRRYFKAGEKMPIIEGSDYGATFWQWDADQAAPSP